MFIVFPYDPFNFCRFCSDVPFIPDRVFWILFFCFLVNLATGLINFCSFVRNQYWEFIDLFLLLFFCYLFHWFLLWSLLFSSFHFFWVWFAFLFLFLVSVLFLNIYLFILAAPRFSCGTQDLWSLLWHRTLNCGMWDLVPSPGSEPRPLHCEFRVLPMGPPGESLLKVEAETTDSRPSFLPGINM